MTFNASMSIINVDLAINLKSIEVHTSTKARNGMVSLNFYAN
jgi:hypothetical protein